MPDITQLIETDHREVEGLFAKFKTDSAKATASWRSRRRVNASSMFCWSTTGSSEKVIIGHRALMYSWNANSAGSRKSCGSAEKLMLLTGTAQRV